MKFVKFFSDCEYNRELLGGKGSNLVKLSKKDFNVPNGFIITTDAYTHFLNNSEYKTELEELLTTDLNPKNIMSFSEKISKYIKKSNIPKDISREIEKAHNLFTNKVGNHVRFSVRSSATIEDCENFSFAGQADTFLFKKSPKEILSSVKKCWNSLFSPRALLYITQIREKNQNMELINIKMAVIVQKMINSDVSGVLFTANVMNSNKKEMLINSTWGVGESLVGNKVVPDMIIVNKESLELVKTIIGKKEKKTVPDYKNSTAKTVKTDIESQKQCCLTEHQIQQICKIGAKIEQFYEYFPQDIEWAIKDDELFILQTRPITTIENKQKT